MFTYKPPTPIPPEEWTSIKVKIYNLVTGFYRSQTLPPTLYHYTDAAGLKGILESGALRATHVNFMNDASEYIHAANLLGDAISEARATSLEPAQSALLSAIEPHLEPDGIGVPLFVACFSQAENDLNQWRAYGRGEGGFAIGFSPADMKLGDGMMLTPVIYDRHRQAELVRKLLNWALAEYLRVSANYNGGDRDEHLGRWVHHLLWFAAMQAPTLKNPSFAAEAEWRLVYLLQSTTHVEYLSKLTGLVPYVNLHIGQQRSPPNLERMADKLPITALWSGPGRMTGMSSFAAGTLLKKLNYPGVTLHVSEIPYRVG